jgi:hypothetical protein
VAVQQLRAGVPGQHDAVEVGGDDGVVRRLDDRRQQRPGLGGFAVRGVVAEHGGHVHVAAGCGHRGQRDLDREDGAVAAPAAQRQAAQRGMGAGEITGPVGRVHPADLLRYEFVDAAPGQALLRVAEHAVGPAVGQRDDAVGAADDHRIRCLVDQETDQSLECHHDPPDPVAGPHSPT